MAKTYRDIKAANADLSDLAIDEVVEIAGRAARVIIVYQFGNKAFQMLELTDAPPSPQDMPRADGRHAGRNGKHFKKCAE